MAAVLFAIGQDNEQHLVGAPMFWEGRETIACLCDGAADRVEQGGAADPAFWMPKKPEAPKPTSVQR